MMLVEVGLALVGHVLLLHQFLFKVLQLLAQPSRTSKCQLTFGSCLSLPVKFNPNRPRTPPRQTQVCPRCAAGTFPALPTPRSRRCGSCETKLASLHPLGSTGSILHACLAIDPLPTFRLPRPIAALTPDGTESVAKPMIEASEEGSSSDD